MPNVGCVPSKAILRNAEIAHLLRTDADTFGIEGATTMRDGAAFERSRRFAVDRVRGLRLLMRKNNIDEYEGRGIFVERHAMRIKGQHIDTQINFDAVVIATGAIPVTAARVHLGPALGSDRERTGRQRPHPLDIVGSAAGECFMAWPER